MDDLPPVAWSEPIGLVERLAEATDPPNPDLDGM
jgi:hypothetical protein